MPISVEPGLARAIFLDAQLLAGTREPDGTADAVRRTVERLGYVQIDAINVVERCHHHIIFNRVPNYRRADLGHAQSVDKAVFEYWTHALAYVPTEHYRLFVPAMRAFRRDPGPRFASTRPGYARS
jgi:uncharacterized protein